MSRLFSGKAAVPFSYELLKPLDIGMSLDITGVTWKAGISINLSSALELTQDVSLSIETRPGKKVIVLNAMKNGKWGKEIQLKWDDMFNPGREFKIRIQATEDGYEILDTDGRDARHLGIFPYRPDINDKACTNLVIVNSAVTIRSIYLHDR